MTKIYQKNPLKLIYTSLLSFENGYVALLGVARSCTFSCTSDPFSFFSRRWKCCILIYANDAFGRSKMPTGALATLVRQRAGVIAQSAPWAQLAQPPAIHMSIIFASESKAKANENERRRMHEMPHYKST